MNPDEIEIEFVRTCSLCGESILLSFNLMALIYEKKLPNIKRCPGCDGALRYVSSTDIVWTSFKVKGVV